MSIYGILRGLAGDIDLLGRYMDFHIMAKESEDGTVVSGYKGFSDRWNESTYRVRERLERLTEVGLISVLEVLEDGTRYAVAGVKANLPEDKYSATFERAWKEYPRRTGHSKKGAWKKWCQLAKIHGRSEEEMLSLVRAYAQYVTAEGTEPRYMKHLSSLLNDDNFDVDWSVPEEEKDSDGLSADSINRSLE